MDKKQLVFGMFIGAILMLNVWIITDNYHLLIPGTYFLTRYDKDVVNITIQSIPIPLRNYTYNINYVAGEKVGVYMPRVDKIEIYSYDNFRGTVIHEIGHRIWFKVLNDTERQEYTTLNLTERAITPYGESNLEEDFAEAFQCYYDEYCLKKNEDSNRIKFIKGIIWQI